MPPRRSLSDVAIANTATANGLVAQAAGCDTSLSVFGGFLSNLLSMWVARGGTVASAVTSTATIANAGNCTNPADAAAQGTTIAGGASGGTVQITLTGLTIDLFSRAVYTPFLVLRLTGNAPTAVQVELLNTDGVTWDAWITDSAPTWRNGMWVGPDTSYAGYPPKGVRLTLTVAAGTTNYVREMGLANMNAPFGRYRLPNLADVNTFYGALTAPTLNAVTGFRVNGAAASGQFLRGNGTNFVSSALTAADTKNSASRHYAWANFR